MRSRIAFALLTLLFLTGLAPATEEHPFAITPESPRLDLSFGRLEWGPTSVLYSQSWSGSQSFGRGYLLKDLRAPLAPGLDFRARFGMAFTPGGGWDGQPRSPELVLPYAALSWEPTENLLLRFEFSHLGSGSPLGMAGYASPWRGSSWHDPHWLRGHEEPQGSEEP